MNTQKIITHARAHKLSLNQLLTILVMRDMPELVHTGKIANAIQTSGASMTGISDKLLIREIITRTVSPTDRRKIFLSLTARGKQIADCILES